jgi:hypothetical protein
VNDGYVGWHKFDAKHNGFVISFPGIDWNKHVQFLSRMEVLEFQGWAIGDVYINVADQYAVHCQGITTFFVDDVMVAGDVFRTGQVKAVLSLKPGVHTLSARVRGKGTASFHCTVTSATDAGASTSGFIEAFQPRLAPDLVVIGDHLVQFSEYFAVPLLNWGPRTLHNISFQITNYHRGGMLQLPYAQSYQGIMSFLSF